MKLMIESNFKLKIVFNLHIDLFDFLIHYVLLNSQTFMSQNVNYNILNILK